MIRRVVTSAILIPIVLALIFWAPVWAYLLAVEAFMLAALWEFVRMLPTQNARGFPALYPLTAAGPWIWVFAGSWVALYLLAGGLLILVWGVARCRDVGRGFSSAAGNLLGFLYIGLPFFMISGFHPGAGGGYERERGLELALIMIVIWSADAGAYFVGRAVGRHKISPLISPNKSLEGYLAALVFGAAAGALLGWLFFSRTPWYAGLLGGLLAAAAIYGDLFESLLKRSCGIKDTSQLIPGHGGVLDRVDSLLFAVPVYHLLTTAARLWMENP